MKFVPSICAARYGVVRSDAEVLGKRLSFRPLIAT